jgi:sugar phosphate isomerase/epimerase
MFRRRFLTLSALAPLAQAIEPFQRPGAPRLLTSLAAYSFRDLLTKQPEKFDLFKFIDFCAEQGLAGAELTSYFFAPNADARYFHRLRRHAYLRGVAISGTAIRNEFALPAGPELEKEIAAVKARIDQAALLGAPHIRVFAGAAKGIDHAGAVQSCLLALTECCAYAGSKGIILGLENHGGIVAEADPLLEIVRAIDSPWLGINLDGGNFRTADPYGDLAKCAPYAVNVQVKTDVQPKGQPAAPVDWARFGTILREAKYQGWVALEYEGKEDPFSAIPPLLAKLKAMCAS